MPKYYYTDPLKAAWMAKEHSVILEHYGCFGEESHKWRDDWWLDLVNGAGLVLPKTFYIHPDCHEMLKPQVGDVGIEYFGGRPSPLQYDDIGGRTGWFSDGYHMSSETCEIIQRNGKAFFMPEVEE